MFYLYSLSHFYRLRMLLHWYVPLFAQWVCPNFCLCCRIWVIILETWMLCQERSCFGVFDFLSNVAYFMEIYGKVVSEFKVLLVRTWKGFKVLLSLRRLYKRSSRNRTFKEKLFHYLNGLPKALLVL